MSVFSWVRVTLALANTARREVEAEPVSILVLMTAIGMVHMAPRFQFHRLGEAGRLARDGGLSALLIAGGVFAAVAAVRTVSREFSSGTAAMALSRAVPRPLFFASKTLGVILSFFRFAVAVVCATFVSSFSCVLGSALVGDDGLTHVYGPCFALGFGGAVLALVGSALAHRFRSRPFVSTCFALLMWTQVIAALVSYVMPTGIPGAEWGWSFVSACGFHALIPVSAVITAFVSVLACAAAAFSIRLAMAPAGVATAIFAASSIFVWRFPALSAVVPDFRRFWLADSMMRGGFPEASAVLSAFGIAALLCALWLTIGSCLIKNKDIG